MSADIFPRHHRLLATAFGQALTAATLGLIVLFGGITLPVIMLLTLAAGVLRGVEHAARQSYAHNVVGAAALVNGLAILGVRCAPAGCSARSPSAGPPRTSAPASPIWWSRSGSRAAGSRCCRRPPRRAAPR